MKKIKSAILGLGILALSAVLTTSCKDEQFSSLYDDPGAVTKGTVSKLFTGVLWNGRDYTFNAYWRQYTWENIFAKYTQTCGYQNNSGSVYYYNDGYANDRWANFYKVLPQYRNMQQAYAAENATSQSADKIYMDLAQVFVLDHLTQLTDLFGAVPYVKAGYLGVNGGDITAASAPFDSDEQLYSDALDSLGVLYQDILAQKSKLSASQLGWVKAQDYLNNGDLDKWAAYANSLRLRLAVHVAAKGSLVNKAKAAIAECLSRKLIDSDANQVEMVPDVDTKKWVNTDDFRTGFCDINNLASQPMVDAMQVTGTDDPRLKVIYSPNKDGKFIGTSRTENENDQANRFSQFNGFGSGAWKDRYYAYLDSATYINTSFVSPVISAAEVDFLKAEAYQQGYVSGGEAAAKQAFIDGIWNSTHFYYRLNMLGSASYGFHATAYPSEADVRAYAEKVWNHYSNKLEAIMTQKWIHFGVIQPAQAWTDIRRTGYPVLSYPEDTQAQSVKTLPNRINYPTTEKTNNTANYAAVSANDNLSTKLFWAK